MCFDPLKQNAVAAAAAAPYQGQYAGFEAYPYTTAAAAAGKIKYQWELCTSNKGIISEYYWGYFNSFITSIGPKPISISGSITLYFYYDVPCYNDLVLFNRV